ncbi:hypothetical protein [Paracoccus versutus]|uniref:Uncharacterized protein n=1 Tax=Paracoccus versutus TaxID=34007 RepID=A0A3D9XPL8_PARVE|nr:hypothetical protein [Paracoccus versutus]REF72365.1 hypothetical protein BDD41_0835 [Paracoccus versutus]WGR55660.1 hypothetical protein E3U25_06680 [Paracoccus versutus]
MSETPRSEEVEQIEAAARVVLGLLRLQTLQPDTVPLMDLPFVLLAAAEERHRQGDYGAERMLCDWADMLRDWEG